MTELADWVLSHQGKVRDIYIPRNESIESALNLLLVATDRVSALDVILTPDIPGKGETLTEVSQWWMSQFPEIPNHATNHRPPSEVAHRALVVRALDMLPVECVVRGYLAGSGWTEYQANQTVCGVVLPEGLREGDQLPQPIFTPATKAAVGDHDINIGFPELAELVGLETARALRDLSLLIYSRAATIASGRGLILADTKFEFGHDQRTGELVWGDEALTPDSSRYWDRELYDRGGATKMSSFDKQPIRDWLTAHWTGDGPPPSLPGDVVHATQDRYTELRNRLIGREDAAL
jgi:phosphoribosylaminoimidazole-succinocarboxamide synthase